MTKARTLANAIHSVQNLVENIDNGISETDLVGLLDESESFIAGLGLTREQEAVITLLIEQILKTKGGTI